MPARLAFALALALPASLADLRVLEGEPLLLETRSSETRIGAVVERCVALQIPEPLLPVYILWAFVAPEGVLIVGDHRGRVHRWNAAGEYELCFEDPPFGTAFEADSSWIEEGDTLRRNFSRTGEAGIELVVRYALDGRLLGVDRYERPLQLAVRRSDGGRWLVADGALELESSSSECLGLITRRPDGKPLRSLGAFDVGRCDELLVIDDHFEPSPSCLGVPRRRALEEPVDRSEYLCEYDAHGRARGQWKLHERVLGSSWFLRLEAEILVVEPRERSVGMRSLEPSTGELRELVFEQTLEGNPIFAGRSARGSVLVVTRFPARLYEVRLPEKLR